MRLQPDPRRGGGAVFAFGVLLLSSATVALTVFWYLPGLEPLPDPVPAPAPAPPPSPTPGPEPPVVNQPDSDPPTRDVHPLIARARELTAEAAELEQEGLARRQDRQFLKEKLEAAIALYEEAQRLLRQVVEEELVPPERVRVVRDRMLPEVNQAIYWCRKNKPM